MSLTEPVRDALDLRQPHIFPFPAIIQQILCKNQQPDHLMGSNTATLTVVAPDTDLKMHNFSPSVIVQSMSFLQNKTHQGREKKKSALCTTLRSLISTYKTKYKSIAFIFLFSVWRTELTLSLSIAFAETSYWVCHCLSCCFLKRVTEWS